MKKVLGFIVVVAVLFVGALMLSAQNVGNNQIDNGPKYWGGPQYYYSTVTIPAGSLYLGGAQVTSGTVTGNVAAAAITNALTTTGSSIGGNIPKAAITNALVGTSALGAIVITNNCNGATNVLYFTSMGILTNWTHTP